MYKSLSILQITQNCLTLKRRDSNNYIKLTSKRNNKTINVICITNKE